MSWNVFDNAANLGDERSGPIIQNYDNVIEYGRGLENHHEMPINDGYPHRPERNCGCLPELQSTNMLANGVYVIKFLHPFQ